MAIFRKTQLRLLLTLLAVGLLAGCATRASYFRLDPSVSSDIRNIDGFQYVPLARLCEVYGLDCKWDAVVRTATITRAPDVVVLRAGSATILTNGTACSIGRPVVLSNGAVFVPLSFVRTGLASMITRPAAPVTAGTIQEAVSAKKFSIRTVVLDTGHGGKDMGAIGRAFGTKEKDLALALSKRVKAILERNNIRVIMTRSDDTFIPLERRADIANRSGAELFVSVHINASKSRFLRGFECYYLSNATDDNALALEAFEDSSISLGGAAAAERSSQLDKTLWDMALTENRMESGELASLICDSVRQAGLDVKNRGVRTARFYVLKHSRIPAVLVEAGYISNRFEESTMKSPDFLDSLADAIARGILRYKNRYEQTEGFTNV